MANADRPSGARPVGTLDGSPYNAAVRSYSVDSSNATAIFRGDFITLEDDGNVAPAAAGGLILGVCVGIKPDRATAATEHPGYLPASTAGTIFVEVGRDVVYEIQDDGVGGTPVATLVGSNADIVAGSGSTTTGISAHELDLSDLIAKDASAASAQLRVIDYVRREDNDVTAINAKWLVIINEHGLTAGGAGL